MFSKLSFTCLLLVSSAIVYAQEQAPPEPSPSEAATEHEPPKAQPAVVEPAESKPPKWDVEHPRGLTTRKVPIDTDEGTWMNLDVSPDGTRVAFDLLGDIYVMPISGGDADPDRRRPRLGTAAALSPDGTRIAFMSDRGGGDNIWVMDLDGPNKQQLTKEDFRLLNQPTGARTAITSSPASISPRPLARHGRNVALPPRWRRRRPDDQASRTRRHQRSSASRPSRPTARPLLHPNVTPGEVFEYAQDSTPSSSTSSATTSTPARRTAVTRPGGAVRPTPSPDGKTLPSCAATGTNRRSM